jgi:hypothetical protein
VNVFEIDCETPDSRRCLERNGYFIAEFFGNEIAILTFGIDKALGFFFSGWLFALNPRIH